MPNFTRYGILFYIFITIIIINIIAYPSVYSQSPGADDGVVTPSSRTDLKGSSSGAIRFYAVHHFWVSLGLMPESGSSGLL
jgi:hypothetical protein